MPFGLYAFWSLCLLVLYCYTLVLSIYPFPCLPAACLPANEWNTNIGYYLLQTFHHPCNLSAMFYTILPAAADATDSLQAHVTADCS